MRPSDMSKISRIAIGVTIVAVLGCAVRVGTVLDGIGETKGTSKFDPQNPEVVRARNAALPELTKEVNAAVGRLPTYGRFREDQCHRGTRGGLDANPDEYQWSCDITVKVMAGVAGGNADAAVKAVHKATSADCSSNSPDGLSTDIDVKPAGAYLYRGCRTATAILLLQRSDSDYLKYSVPGAGGNKMQSGDYRTFVPPAQPDAEESAAQLRADGYRYAVVAEATKREYYEMKWPDK